MKYKYPTLAILAAIIAAIAFMISETSTDTTPCRGGWKFHNWTRWKADGHTSNVLTRDRILMERHCLTCGHIQTKQSD